MALIKTKYKSGFTLIELLVVVGIIAVLTSLLVPVIIRARRVSADTATQTAITRVCEGYANDVSTGATQIGAASAVAYYNNLSTVEKNYVFTSNNFVTRTSDPPTYGRPHGPYYFITNVPFNNDTSLGTPSSGPHTHFTGGFYAMYEGNFSGQLHHVIKAKYYAVCNIDRAGVVTYLDWPLTEYPDTTGWNPLEKACDLSGWCPGHSAFAAGGYFGP